MNTILVPIDFSPVTDAVLATAARFAKSLGGSITLLHTTRPPALVNEYNVEFGRMATDEEVAVEGSLDRYRLALELRGIPVDVVRTSGSPISDILRTAQRLDPACIVMGSHGHTALYDLFVGSTTKGVLAAATWPVLIVPVAYAALNGADLENIPSENRQ